MIKKLAFVFVFVAGFALGQTKKVVSSDVQWWGYKIAKTEASSHTGTVNIKTGTVTLKKNALVGGTFVLDMTTINDTDLQGEYQQKLNTHLKTGDFFEVDKYPTATFTITSVKKGNNGKNVIKGNLTAKGKTKAVSFPAVVSLKNGEVALVSDKFTIDRQKWGIAYQSTMKDVLVKDDIDLVVKLTAK